MSDIRPSAPKIQTVIISVVAILFGLFGALISPTLAENGDWFLLIGYVILLVGVFVKGV